jgi:hypothetical protein
MTPHGRVERYLAAGEKLFSINRKTGEFALPPKSKSQPTKYTIMRRVKSEHARGEIGSGYWEHLT